MTQEEIETWFADHSRYGHVITGEGRSDGSGEWQCSCGATLMLKALDGETRAERRASATD